MHSTIICVNHQTRRELSKSNQEMEMPMNFLVLEAHPSSLSLVREVQSRTTTIHTHCQLDLISQYLTRVHHPCQVRTNLQSARHISSVLGPWLLWVATPHWRIRTLHPNWAKCPTRETTMCPQYQTCLRAMATWRHLSLVAIQRPTHRCRVHI